MIQVTDWQGGSGNGSAWYCNDFDAPVLLQSQYAELQAKRLGDIDINDVKALLAGAKPSAESAPIINYLFWVHEILKSMA